MAKILCRVFLHTHETHHDGLAPKLHRSDKRTTIAKLLSYSVVSAASIKATPSTIYPLTSKWWTPSGHHFSLSRSSHCFQWTPLVRWTWCTMSIRIRPFLRRMTWQKTFSVSLIARGWSIALSRRFRAGQQLRQRLLILAFLQGKHPLLRTLPPW